VFSYSILVIDIPVKLDVKASIEGNSTIFFRSSILVARRNGNDNFIVDILYFSLQNLLFVQDISEQQGMNFISSFLASYCLDKVSVKGDRAAGTNEKESKMVKF
jgi:hypothetical protein